MTNKLPRDARMRRDGMMVDDGVMSTGGGIRQQLLGSDPPDNFKKGGGAILPPQIKTGSGGGVPPRPPPLTTSTSGGSGSGPPSMPSAQHLLIEKWGTETWRKKRRRISDEQEEKLVDDPVMLLDKWQEDERAKVKEFLDKPLCYPFGVRALPPLKGVLPLSETESDGDVRAIENGPQFSCQWDYFLDDTLYSNYERRSSGGSRFPPPSPSFGGDAILYQRRGLKRSFSDRTFGSGAATPVDEVLPESSEDEEDIEVLDRVLLDPPMQFIVVSGVTWNSELLVEVYDDLIGCFGV